jgi:hypothetical protein
MHLHRLAEERSLAFHRAVAERLHADPAIVMRATERLRRWRTEGSLHGEYFDAWMEILGRPIDQIITALADGSERMRALRQTTPFAGAIDPRTRWRIWRETKRRLEAEGA